MAQSQPSPAPDAQYHLGPDSLPQPGVPRGERFEFTYDQSRIFSGTTRKIEVYIPAQYRAERPACVLIMLDGIQLEAATVLDNLIHQRAMPITIVVGIRPGTVPSARPPASPRYDRSLEFDSLNDDLARFILEEILPEVERRRTRAGLPILLSQNPNDRAAAGGSTGAIAAFTLAWQRPDAFRRVFSAIGTYVAMRGGDGYPALVRKTEPKPIRIFLQDGSNDNLDTFLGEIGNWWLSNLAMLSALEFAGYDVAHDWGVGSHHPAHPAAVFPAAMRWLWRDYPAPIEARPSHNVALGHILAPGANWEVVAGGYQSVGSIAVAPGGDIVFLDPQGGGAWRVSADGPARSVPDFPRGASALAFDANDRLYVSADRALSAYDANHRRERLSRGLRFANLITTNAGAIYAVEAGERDGEGKLWLIRPNGQSVVLDRGLNHPAGIEISPDGLWLVVSEPTTQWAYSYQIAADGTVQSRRRFYRLHSPDAAEGSGANSLAMDRDGRLYAATRLGVQVMDRNGRSRAIIPIPGDEARALAFGGADFSILYASGSDGRLYRRMMRVPGTPAWSEPIELPQSSPA